MELVIATSALLVLIGGFKVKNRIKRLRETKRVALIEAKRKQSLNGIVVSVFVRESNGSRTNIEHHIEHELIDQGAEIVSADQKTAMALLRDGKFELFAPANLLLVGTLRLIDTTVEEIEYTESGFEFQKRKAEWRAEYNNWLEWGDDEVDPKPVLEPRRGREAHQVSAIMFQLCFRTFSSLGSVLASGTSEVVVKRDNSSLEVENGLKELAREAIASLDEENVWNKVSI